MSSLALAQPGFEPMGQDDQSSYPLRAFLNKFSVNLSSGYGRTFYRHTLTNNNYVRTSAGSFIYPNGESGTNPAYANWFNGVSPANLTLPTNPDSLTLVTSDSSSINMQGGGYNIPINLLIYFNLYRFRIGGGISADFHRVNPPQPEDFRSFFPAPPSFRTTQLRYFGMLGYSVYEYYDYAFGVDLRAGVIRMGRGFDRGLVEASPFFNAGVTIEKVFSEYFRVYLRPAYEFKSYNLQLPDGPTTAMSHRNSAVFLTLGVSINYPDMPRSPIKADKTQMKHYVTDPKTGVRREVRGQPFWRKQDPKIGELYPELIKTKRKRQARRKQFFRKKKK
ncbi:hypothetical protein [Tunicatimonas pelagia]|uniref:hypothetical protein n=1 Tax=Tunicatimonas pelagia TaxID=931531 RepID=UPI002666FDE7|nr:hypothetical protein [Tunicatimonas pelagia]WKN43101.1 hypothetical protein P0M28_29100 [Tunicatimonas pelagia]